MLSPKPRIITPTEALVHGMKVRPRNAPPATAHAALGGWMEWGLVDRRGNTIQGGQQHNLLLDTYLNRIATTTIFAGYNQFSNMTLFLTHAAVGTGSVEPAVTDTGLVAEIARTSTFVGGSTTTVNLANGEWEFSITYEFDFGVGNGNLTEWGIADGSVAPILIRELFRDELGEPITVTKTSDYKLRIKYTMGLTLSPVVLTAASFTITGIGVINGSYTVTGSKAVLVFGSVVRAKVTTNVSASEAYVALSASALSGYGSNIASSFLAGGGMTVSPFVDGVWEREISTAVFGTANGNMASVATIGVQHGSGNSSSRIIGFGFGIDLADRFTKDDLHILTINRAVKYTWGRAP